MLALFLFVTTVQADCTFPHQYILYCNEIEVFPIIEQRTDIVFIDIENTQLRTLPVFTHEQWPKLEFITFKNNTYLPCSEIQKQIQDHIFYIDHDCVESDTVTEITPNTESTPKYKRPTKWIIISICTGIASILFIVIIKVLLKSEIQGNHDCSFQSV